MGAVVVVSQIRGKLSLGGKYKIWRKKIKNYINPYVGDLYINLNSMEPINIDRWHKILHSEIFKIKIAYPPCLEVLVVGRPRPAALGCGRCVVMLLQLFWLQLRSRPATLTGSCRVVMLLLPPVVWKEGQRSRKKRRDSITVPRF